MGRSCSSSWLTTTASSTSTVLTVLLLLQGFKSSEGAACPARAAYIPEQTLGCPYASYNLLEPYQPGAVPLYWSRAGPYLPECCESGRIVNWTISLAEETQNVAQINATCSDGQQLSTPLYGRNGTQNGTETCINGIVPGPQTVYQPDDEGVFPFESTQWVTKFLGVGNPVGGNKGSASCPAGTRPIGLGARSSCYGIVSLQVVCAKTSDGESNLSENPDSNPTCSAYMSTASNTSLIGTEGWRNPNATKYATDANATQTECCPVGEAVANWTIGINTALVGGDYTGLIQGTCTDNTILAPIKYGFNGTGLNSCNQQNLSSIYQYSTPKSQQFYYTTKSAGENLNGRANLLTSFMAPTYPTTANMSDRLSLSCPQGQVAVGYSAASMCYSIANVSILCGNASESAKLTLDTFGSTQDNPPTEAEAGICPGGLSIIPRGTYATQATESPLVSACCPSGLAIAAFNVWPSSNNQVGKVSAACSSWSDGREATITSEIAYGYNGTSVDGSTSFCPNTTNDADMKKQSIKSGTWNYRSDEQFETLSVMDWPQNGNGSVSSTSSSCPAGQSPIAFAARKGCTGLSDFRVICGTADIKIAQTGLTTGAKAGIAVGVVAAVALIALAAFLVWYKREQKRKTHIESKQLFNLNGPAGFHSGITTAGKESVASSYDSRGSSKILSTGLMTIEDIDRSNDDTPVSFEGIPQEWEIKRNQIKLHCVDGKPIELGRGGFGVVLLGTVHKEDAAIKMIKGRSNENELLKEIAILERAKTKYVVRFLGYSVCPDGILLAMEYMPGGTLWQAIRDSQEFQWHNRGQKAFKDICKGLYMLHSNQIAHLDMKTPNVLIADDGTCKISDLGLGKLLKNEVNSVTAESMGSFAWMAPEHLMGRCGFSSDIWALSTIIWELCKMKTPTREALPADIEVPREAPQHVVDLMIACRQESPKDRPLIGTICDLLDSWEETTRTYSDHVSVQM